MDMGPRSGLADPKPEKRSTTKGRKARAEATQKTSVRAQCVDRDGYCRWARFGWQGLLGVCDGRSEWSHLGDKKRARTRGQAPEVRHTTAGSLMQCQRHHTAYDAGKFDIEPTTDAGADGLLRVRSGPYTFTETAMPRDESAD